MMESARLFDGINYTIGAAHHLKDHPVAPGEITQPTSLLKMANSDNTQKAVVFLVTDKIEREAYASLPGIQKARNCNKHHGKTKRLSSY